MQLVVDYSERQAAFELAEREAQAKRIAASDAKNAALAAQAAVPQARAEPVGSVRKVRHWRQKFDPKAQYVLRRQATFDGVSYGVGAPVPPSVSRKKLMRMFDAHRVELAPSEYTVNPVDVRAFSQRDRRAENRAALVEKPRAVYPTEFKALEPVVKAAEVLAAPTAPTITRAHANKTALSLKESHGSDVLLEVLAGFEAKRMSDLTEGQLVAFVEACQGYAGET